jgi:hypothetical protein
VPPTLLTLEDLAESHARHRGIEAMLAAERGRATPPVMPRIDIGSDEIRVLMPWDPGYAATQGEGCMPAAGFPLHLLRRKSCVTVRRDLGPSRKSAGPGHEVPGPRDPAT